MKGNWGKKWVYALIVCMLLPLFTQAPNVKAVEPAPIQTTDIVHNEAKVISVNQQTSLYIQNSEPESMFRMITSGETIYENTIPLGYVEKVHQWKVDEKPFTAIEYRLDGTGSSLFFTIFMEDQIVFQSKEYLHGKLVLNGLDTLRVSFPKYESGDAMAMPSSIIEEQYVMDGSYKYSLSGTSEREYQPQGYSAKATGPYTNPSPDVINKYLTNAAKKNNVPPEIFKAIVWQESTWRQFTSSGYPLIGYDGRGLGITQVTYPKSYLDARPGMEERLKTDTEFNINEGIKILMEKWNSTYVPWINDHSPEEIEHWYFAILAYNGYSKKNDPRLTSTERTLANYPKEAYQDTIYRHMNGDMGLVNVTPFPINQLSIKYNTNSTLMIFTDKKQYDIPGPFTLTKHNYESGNVVANRADGLKLRSHATTDNAVSTVKRELMRGETLTVTGDIRFASDKFQHYGWYPVKTQDGMTGFVASSYLTEREGFLKEFPDLTQTSRGYSEVATLVENSVISGYGDGSFQPDKALSRLEAAILFVRELGLNKENVVNPEFKDVSTNNKFYKDIAAAQNAGIFLGDGKGNFNGSQLLTRGEMAAALVRAYDFANRSDTPFVDIKGTVFKPSIESIYHYNITSGISETKYGPREQISRRDFSIFLFRSTVTSP